jgi:hypothetical protein
MAKFRLVVRVLALVLLAAGLTVAIWLVFRIRYASLLGATPPPPTILAPRGEMPSAAVAFREFAQYQGEAYRPVGCGFFLRLPGGQVVGVTPAHAVLIGDPGHPLERIALIKSKLDRADFVGEFDTLWGPPGRHFTLEDMSLDYVLLRVDRPVEPGLVLTPDPRGLPQPGERVTLFSGVDGRAWAGTVQSAEDRSVWVVMDEKLDPSGMSGSPFVSQHTGQLMGMAVAASPRWNRVWLGVHPVGSLVRLAESATEFPKLPGH